MSQYFDSTFFRFFFGFLAILMVSLALLMVTNYFANKEPEPAENTSSAYRSVIRETVFN
jgi:hypothetical protein